jgi:hypothetical protein
MNRIYLDKLCEFSTFTYKNNYEQFNKKINIDELINSVKQNSSLNEKGNFIKYNFVDVNNIIINKENTIFDQNEIILVQPLSFNIDSNYEWYSFLNAILIVLNDTYSSEINLKKKKILETADNIYSKKLDTSKLTDSIINSFCKYTEINIIILHANNYMDSHIYDFSDKYSKWIILLKYNNDYYPFINWKTKFYEGNSIFVKELITKAKLKDNKVFKGNDAYEELPLQTNEDYLLYVSEVVDDDKKKSIIDLKKNKSKNKKDIFVANDKKDIIIEEPIFAKTDLMTVEKINKICNSITIKSSLADLQKCSLDLGLTIVAGSTKIGKPKNKTKSELYDQITEFKASVK